MDNINFGLDEDLINAVRGIVSVSEGYDSSGAYEKWDPKHPSFVKNYKKFKAKKPDGSLEDYINHLKGKKVNEEVVSEKLHPNQKQLDKNKNGKLDAQDFKLLRKEEEEVVEEEQIDEESTEHLKNANKAKKYGMMNLYHKHMRNHYEELGDKQSAKAKSFGDFHSVGKNAKKKATEYYKKADEHDSLREEVEQIDEAKLQHSIYQVGVSVKDKSGPGTVGHLHRVTVKRGDDEEERAKAAVAKHYGDTPHKIDSIRKGLFNRQNPDLNKGISEDYEQIDEISGKVLGSYIQKARADAKSKYQHQQVIEAHPSVKKHSDKLSDYHSRREYTKSGESKYRKQMDTARKNKSAAMTKLDPNLHKTGNQGASKRMRGIEKAADKLRYGKLTNEELDNYSLEDIQDFMVSEDFEQLDEISKATLGSYVKKASDDAAQKQGLATANSPFVVGGKYGNAEVSNAAHVKSQKRLAGISKATDKLTKEQVEEIEALAAKHGLTEE